MAVDPTALKTLIDATPAAKAEADAGDHAGCAAVLNAVDAGSGITVARETVTAEELMDQFVPGEYATLTAVQLSRLWHVLGLSTIRIDSDVVRAIVLNCFPAGSQTRTNLGTLTTRPGSLAEEALGAGVTVTHRDVREAMKGGA